MKPSRILILIGLLMIITSRLTTIRFHGASLIGGVEPSGHTNMPPGFELAVDTNGNYAAKFSGIDLIITDDLRKVTGTKQLAIDRAWEQYNYEHKDDEEQKKWHPAESK